ncbi:MAG: hypothetical protein ACOVOR_03120 [Rhabdochlamydiaceae bacterium]
MIELQKCFICLRNEEDYYQDLKAIPRAPCSVTVGISSLALGALYFLSLTSYKINVCAPIIKNTKILLLIFASHVFRNQLALMLLQTAKKINLKTHFLLHLLSLTDHLMADNGNLFLLDSIFKKEEALCEQSEEFQKVLHEICLLMESKLRDLSQDSKKNAKNFVETHAKNFRFYI